LKEKRNNLRVLVTAGPTREHIDPVRYLTNASSGEMGLEIARACQKIGATTTVVLGPTELSTPASVRTVRVESASQMSKVVKQLLPRADVFVATAAVSDWRVKKISPHKMKRGDRTTLTLSLVANPDILAEAGAWKKKRQAGKPVLIGFALETRNVANAMMEKMRRKNLDLIIGNAPSSFGARHMNAHWLERNGIVKKLGVVTKRAMAAQLAQWIKVHG
jgi:phosphopantothenoylcysteine decarboxylase/phosphopantothenate--cysteine ligase